MAEPAGLFTYFLARPGPRPPHWIRPLQWVLVAVWLLFSHWICLGHGHRIMASFFYNFHGVFTEEILWPDGILPNLGLVTVAVTAALTWLQVLWLRCRVAVQVGSGGWCWTGRKGPVRPERAGRTAGGAWVRAEGRWWYVAHGFAAPDGESLLGAAALPPAPWAHWTRFASPLLLLLLVVVLSAWALQRPVLEDRRVRGAASKALWERDERALESLVIAHPEIRPWVRYIQSQRASNTAQGLREVLAARLEGISIGPAYGNEQAVLGRLLILNGKSELALLLAGREGREAYEVAARMDRPDDAHRPAHWGPGTHTDLDGLLLLERGRFEEAYALSEAVRGAGTQRATAQRAVLAFLTGRCAEADQCARRLLAPHAFNQSALLGDAPATGLGALQRAAREVRVHASCALGLALVAQLEGAWAEWSTAEALADRAGLSGLLDVDRVLLRRVAPEGPWRRAAGRPARPAREG